MTLIFLALIANIVAVPLPLAQKGDRWSQACSQDNDLNSNGGISFREFTEFALSLMKLSRSELERLFLAGDVDRNSELDGEECIPMRKLLKSTLNEKAELLFEKYSTNGGRNLTLEEVSSLARNEFQVIPNDTQRIFTFSDQAFDRNHDGKVSYEEIKPEMIQAADGFTLKQLFKSIDFDKDYYLTTLEYLALLNELKIHEEGPFILTPRTIDMAMSKITSMPVVRTGRKSAMTEMAEEMTESVTSTDPNTEETTANIWSTAVAVAQFQIRERRSVGREMTRVAPTRTIHELSHDDKSFIDEETMDTNTSEQKRSKYYVEMLKRMERGYMKRIKREGNDDDDKAAELPEELMQLKKDEMLKLSEQVQNNLSGGGRTPSIDDSVTVPYDSEDFQ
ncbi:hypothetical protein Angca_000129 [Angiostrongylus cantonensis]|nr:hypothetical protein Angca_000129 [Angiostrongylus cantonensis]